MSRTTLDCVQSLRSLADDLEKLADNEEFSVSFVAPRIYVPLRDVEQMRKIVQTLGGHWDKTGDDYTFDMIKRYNNWASLLIYANRDDVCERKQVGTKIELVPDPDVEVPKVEREVPVYEWICPTVLQIGSAYTAIEEVGPTNES